METKAIIDKGNSLIQRSNKLRAEAQEYILESMKSCDKIIVYDNFDDMGVVQDEDDAYEKITNISPIITIADAFVEDVYLVGIEYDNICNTIFLYVCAEDNVNYIKTIDFELVLSCSYLTIVEFIAELLNND